MTVFVISWKKKNKKLSVLLCGRGFFCVKLCTVGWHNAMARIGLETNSSGDVLLEKKKSSIATINLWAQNIWSNDFFLHL